MELSSLISLAATILSGGPQAIMLVLLIIIFGLLWDRKKLIKDIDKKDDRIDKIVEDYYRGNLSLTSALSSLQTVLQEIKSKL